MEVRSLHLKSTRYLGQMDPRHTSRLGGGARKARRVGYRKKWRWTVKSPLRCAVVETVVVIEVDQFTRRAHRRARELGMLVSDVAEAMGVSPGRLSQLLTGERIQAAQFRKLSSVLQMTEADWTVPLPKELTVEDGREMVRQRIKEKVARLRQTTATTKKRTTR